MKPRILLAAATFAALATSALAAPATAPKPLPSHPPGSAAVLLGVDRVRKELGLTSLQRAVLNDIRTDYRDDARAITAKAAADPAQKKAAQAQLEALTARSNRRALAALNSDQRATFQKIERQYLGAFALLDPAIQSELALTAKQKTKLAHVWWHYDADVMKINRAYELGKLSHNQRMLELRDIRYDASDDLLERLTKEQLAKFNALTARPA